jgi:two-component system sensor kinase FixL
MGLEVFQIPVKLPAEMRNRLRLPIDLLDPATGGRRAAIVTSCVTAAAVLTFFENYLGLMAQLSGLLLIPLLVAAAYLSRISIFLFSLAITVAWEYFGANPWNPHGPERLVLELAAFAGPGLLIGELIRTRRLSAELSRQTKQERDLRLEAEQEARALVESSPAAMVTVDSDGRIAKINQAARQLLGFPSDSPEGDRIGNYIPLLGNLMESTRRVQSTRGMVEVKGRRRDGQEFYLNAWVSIYSSTNGPKLSAILLDVTEQIRDHAETGLRQLLSNSRIIAGAVSHELRNLAAAASILHLNMRNIPGLPGTTDYEALGTVIESVRKLSSTDLSEAREGLLAEQVDVVSLLRELRTIITPESERCGVQLEWEVAEEIPPVRAERSGLLQVLLNLAQNSFGVLGDRAGGRLRVVAYALPESVLIRLADNGPGISSAERLFQPFQPGASSTGLGLFVSRAIIRTFGGELHHTQRPGECCFIIEFPRDLFPEGHA